MAKSNLITFVLSVCLIHFLIPIYASTTQTFPKTLNIALLGSTGNGKSATCNTLYGESSDFPFKVGHRASGQTSQVIEFTSKSKNIRIIDTPGFGDNRFDEVFINSVIRQFAQVVMDPLSNQNPQIDAFVLVVRLNPRASSLKNDIIHARDLFGSVVFKSMILLVIHSENPESNATEFLEDLKEMKELVKTLKDAKNEEPNENWFVMWDNKKPRPGQEKELLAKISKLEPYTHKKFIEADKEIKERINAQIQDSVQRETTRLKREFQDDQAILQEKLSEMEIAFSKEKKELIKAREEAVKISEKAQKTIEQQGGFSWKDTLLAGVVGYRYGPVGAVLSALAVNLWPGDFQDDGTYTTGEGDL